MNHLCQRGEPSAGQTSMLPDFILNAAKRAHILVHTCMHRADVIPSLCFSLCFLPDGSHFGLCCLQCQEIDAW